MTNRFENALNKISDAANTGLALLVIGQPTADVQKEVYDPPIQLAQAGNGMDALQLLRGERVHSRHGGSQVNATRLESFGSIASMDLPQGYRSVTPETDTGYLSMDYAPKLFQAQQDAFSKLGFWNRELKQPQVFENLKEIFRKPPHQLSDDEYFQISGDLMPPGPWSGNGRGHEISIKTDVLNGRNVIVYDYWMGKDPARDTFESKLGADDIRCRVVFAPNEKTGQVDVMWMQSPNNEFNKRAAEFDRSLKSIRWK